MDDHNPLLAGSCRCSTCLLELRVEEAMGRLDTRTHQSLRSAAQALARASSAMDRADRAMEYAWEVREQFQVAQDAQQRREGPRLPEDLPTPTG
jgi:hypothetical protein